MVDQRIEFPNPNQATADGLLAMGGDLSVDTLIAAYQQGIFPWFNAGQPILWWSPDPRLVLFPAEFKCARSLRKAIRNANFTVTANTCFEDVLQACASRGLSKALPKQAPVSLKAESAEQWKLDAAATDNDRTGTAPPTPITWISQEMRTAYTQLHLFGVAHSIEVWRNQRLVGGLYGIKLGKIFYGESMFSVVSNASKIATAYLCAWGAMTELRLIDCQIHSDHLASLGARTISRAAFLRELTSFTRLPDYTEKSQLRDQFAKLTPELIVENVINNP